jgi:hypothetical protein
MEILIWIDDEDKKKWQAIRDLHNSIVATVIQDRNSNVAEENKKLSILTSDFWHNMIEKYPYLRNKKIGMNAPDGYIFSYASLQELQQYSRP